MHRCSAPLHSKSVSPGGCPKMPLHRRPKIGCTLSSCSILLSKQQGSAHRRIFILDTVEDSTYLRPSRRVKLDRAHVTKRTLNLGTPYSKKVFGYAQRMTLSYISLRLTSRIFTSWVGDITPRLGVFKSTVGIFSPSFTLISYCQIRQATSAQTS